MIRTITKRPYSFFAGRTSAGKRIQITKSGFDTSNQRGLAAS